MLTSRRDRARRSCWMIGRAVGWRLDALTCLVRPPPGQRSTSC